MTQEQITLIINLLLEIITHASTIMIPIFVLVKLINIFISFIVGKVRI